MKKLLILLLILLFLPVTSQAEVLINNLNVNYVSKPYYIAATCNHDTLCISIYSNSSINGEAINISSDMGEIDSIKIALKRTIYTTLPNNNATITLRVYKSFDSTPTSSKYLWDSITLNPTSSSLQSYLFTFDYPIEVYVDNVYTVKWLWIEVQETYTDVDNNNPIEYGFYNSYSDNKYIYSDNYQYYNAAWTLIESHYTEPWYNDIAFNLYGSWHYPNLPSTPSPTVTVGDNGTLPCPDCNGTMFPNQTGGSGFSPNFSAPTVPCPDCIGNETITPNGNIPSDKGVGSVLKSIGYCTTSGCSIDDIIGFLYDISITWFWISVIILIIKSWSIYNQR